MLTFVSAHMFFASCKGWFNNYATKNTTNMKTKFIYCDQIEFNEPALRIEG